MTQEQFSQFKAKLSLIKSSIIENKDKLEDLLLNYESYEVVEDELFKSVDAIENIDIEKEYFLKSKKFDSMSVFFPMNLPLYSLIIFAVIPSALFSKVHIRPPQIANDILPKIFKILDLNKIFDNLFLYPDSSREDFINNCVKRSDVVMFTGTYKNANRVLTQCNIDTIFIFQGAGINPVLIEKDCNLDDAVDKVVKVKTFNCGQDCAGSDGILVHKDIKPQFLEKLVNKLKEMKVGDYRDRDVVIGKIGRIQHFETLSKKLVSCSKQIHYGGVIDFKEGIVTPTVIEGDIKNPSYDELFAPVFYILEFSNDEQLNNYFGHSIYQKNNMYLSVFGNSKLIDSNNFNSIVIKDDIIMNVERGNKEFGGYGEYASFIRFNKQTVRQPILISRDLSKYASVEKN